MYLKPYLLTSRNPEHSKILKENAFGVCYAKLLQQSSRAEFWGQRIPEHFARTLGLQLLAELASGNLYLNPRTKLATWVMPGGVSLDLPLKKDMNRGTRENELRYVKTIQETNLHDLPAPLASEIQAELSAKRGYTLHTLAEQLDVLDCFRHPEALQISRLLFDRSLKVYWNAAAISCILEYHVPIPEEIVQALNSTDAR